MSLKDLLTDLTENDQIHFCFITNAKLTERIEDEFERLKKKYEEENDRLSFELKGFTDIRGEYKCVMSEAECIAEEVRISIETMQDTFSNEKRPSYFDLSAAIGSENSYRSNSLHNKGEPR